MTQLNMQKKNKKSVILGLNGWMERGHDASACLMVNDKIVAFAEEERFTRKRYSYDSLPILSTAFCLAKAKVGVDDIDTVVWGWDMPKTYKMRRGKFLLSQKEILGNIFPKDLYQYKTLPKLEFVNHHLAHAASAYRVSGFNDASILVLDGQGEDSSGTLAFGKNGDIKVVGKIPISFSLGYMMEAACKFLGLRTSDAGKLMGLAGHGKKASVFDNLVLNKNGYSFKKFATDTRLIGGELDEQGKVIEQWLKYFRSKYDFNIKRETVFNISKGILTTKIDFDQKHKDFALSVQKTLEEVVMHLAKLIISRSGSRNLVIAGGIGLNCTTNGRLVAEGLVDGLFVQPAANDAGVSMGAALETSYTLYKKHPKKLDHIYLGPSYSDKQIEKELQRLKIPYKNIKDIHKIAAKALSEGKVVAWFQGKMEGGPRALGNRSILANPKLRNMHNVVNEIKSREDWRPLAPSILEESVSDYFETGAISPFMLQTHRVRKERISEIPAVVHDDSTARYQSVSKKTNSKYHALIKEFYRLTRTPVVMNTSLNIGGEPLVCTPEQTVKTFYLSAIDCMAIGNFWITKNEN
jgi:carbamoyltransferase